ncbi:MAG: YfhO family protein, partial [Chloroflexota bacterium]|nr:YfhO family protein [Chloroflexota bacterium]
KIPYSPATETIQEVVRGLMGLSPHDGDRTGLVSAEQLVAWGAVPRPAPLEENGRSPDGGAVGVSRWQIAGQDGGAASGAATLVVEEPERIIVETDAARPGILVLTDTFYPGWRVTVDGAPASLLQANYLFRGVHVPAGAHRIEFTYHPTPFQRGLLVSALTLAIVLGTLLWPPVRRAWRSNRAAPGSAESAKGVV